MRFEIRSGSVAMLASAMLMLPACKQEAAKHYIANGTGQDAAGAKQAVTIDTLGSGDNQALTVNATSARQLPAAAPDSAEAAIETLHRAVAYIQADRINELRPLLSDAAKAQLAKAGGDDFLKNYKSARVEFADKAMIDASHMTATMRFRVHLAGSATSQIRLGEAALRRTVRDTTTPWQIESVVIRAPN